MKNLIKLSLGLSIVLAFASCTKETDDVTGTGSLTFHFDNRAGADDLVFGQTYTLPNSQQINFSTFNYYVSNFVLVKADGTTYTVPQDSCYFLVKENDLESQEVTINGVPAGDYTSVRFIIGVDSLKSVADISQRTGDLDPAGDAADAYWGWNTGYIFVKIEGTSPQAPLDAMTNTNFVMYHVGGYGGYSSPTPNNIKSVSLTAPEAMTVRKTTTPEVHFYADALQAFSSPTTVDFTTDPTVVHWGAFHTTVANNYADMFSIDHVHND